MYQARKDLVSGRWRAPRHGGVTVSPWCRLPRASRWQATPGDRQRQMPTCRGSLSDPGGMRSCPVTMTLRNHRACQKGPRAVSARHSLPIDTQQRSAGDSQLVTHRGRSQSCGQARGSLQTDAGHSRRCLSASPGGRTQSHVSRFPAVTRRTDPGWSSGLDEGRTAVDEPSSGRCRRGSRRA